MATQALGRNPIRVASGDTFTATTDKVRLRAIFWDCSGATAADTAVVQDNPTDGRAAQAVWSATQLATLVPSFYVAFSGKGLAVNGLQITAPTHGVLYVYLVDSVD